MGNGSLGQMANAPLALVLAQVRFSPYLTLASHVASLQDAVRKNYPGYRPENAPTVEILSDGKPPKITIEESWYFADVENREGFVLQSSFLLFWATRYATFDDFSERHKFVMRAFQEVVPNVLVEQLGLRYIDIIVPGEGERPGDYVIEQLRGCEDALPNAEAFRSQYLARWKVGEGHLSFRYSIGLAAPFLPPDLRDMKLSHAEIIERAVASKCPIGTMDFDRIESHRAVFRSDDVAERFKRMHGELSTVFRRAMSERAEQLWNPKS
jgi:uncharacterized protein (TIGR04255 family)